MTIGKVFFLVKTLSPLCFPYGSSKVCVAATGVQRFLGAVLRCRALFVLIEKPEASLRLWFKICFAKEWRVEEIRDIDIQALANLMDQAELDRIIRAIHDVSNGGFWYAALHIELVLCHIALQ